MTYMTKPERQPVDLAKPEAWPVLLTLPEIAQIVVRSVAAIRKDLQAGTFVPAPFGERPYRWRRDDVIRWLRNDRDVPRKRREQVA